MRVSTDYLVSEVERLKVENRRLRDKLRHAKASRDRWRSEAWYWKWGALGKTHHGTPRFIAEEAKRRLELGLAVMRSQR